MKALSLWQPWASYIAVGMKQFETRAWETHYRGPLAIHAAARRLTPGELELLEEFPLPYGHGPLPFGAIVATCELVNCTRMTDANIAARSPIELELGDWYPGRFAWALAKVVALPKPVPARGVPGLWYFDDVAQPLAGVRP
jgi:hypothetical protein